MTKTDGSPVMQAFRGAMTSVVKAARARFRPDRGPLLTPLPVRRRVATVPPSTPSSPPPAELPAPLSERGTGDRPPASRSHAPAP